MFHQPTTLQDALHAKATLGDRARFIAGGTDLVVAVNKGKLVLDHVIDLTRIRDLQALDRDGDAWRIGGGVTHARLGKLAVRGLALAADTVGGPQIRNRGTIAGNLATASPAGDVAVALLALDAELELLSLRGVRRMPLSEFFIAPGRTHLAPDELIAAVRIPADGSSTFLKVGKRLAIAISLVMAAGSIDRQGKVRLALGCVAPRPMRALQAEAATAGGLTPEAIRAAGEAAEREVSPITDHRGSADYRRALSRVLVGRVLNELAQEVAHA